MDESEEEDKSEESSGKKGKISKKSIELEKIILNYYSEILILRKLAVDKEMTPSGKLKQLYFSLAKCDFNIEKLTHSNRLFKNIAKNSHTLLTISSITLKQFLSNINANAPDSKTLLLKKKSLIHVKNPVFLLPECDISDRLVNYLKTFDSLEPYIAAFLQNTTN